MYFILYSNKGLKIVSGSLGLMQCSGEIDSCNFVQHKKCMLSERGGKRVV